MNPAWWRTRGAAAPERGAALGPSKAGGSGAYPSQSAYAAQVSVQVPSRPGLRFGGPRGSVSAAHEIPAEFPGQTRKVTKGRRARRVRLASASRLDQAPVALDAGDPQDIVDFFLRGGGLVADRRSEESIE